MNKNKLRLLSKLYFKKSLGYNWYDILKLKSRQSVIQDINKYDNISIKTLREYQNRFKYDKAHKEHKEVIRLQKTKIKQVNKALKRYTQSYEINIINNKDQLIQLKNIKAVETHIESVLASMKGLKCVETLKGTFEKPASNDQLIVKTAYFNSQAQIIINQTEILAALQ